MAKVRPNEEEIVAQVKSERCGPAASWGDDVPLTASEREVVERRLAEQDEDDTPEVVSADDIKGALGLSTPEAQEEALQALGVPINGETEETGESTTLATDGLLSDDEIGEANAADLVDYLRDHPDEADRVESIEAGRDEPRKTVSDAIDRARTSGEDS